jgi:hypothetical protein
VGHEEGVRGMYKGEQKKDVSKAGTCAATLNTKDVRLPRNYGTCLLNYMAVRLYIA